MLRSGLKARTENGWLMGNPEFLGSLAEGLLASGEAALALAAVEEAVTISRQRWRLCCLADLLRIKAEILLVKDPSELSRAEVLFAEGLVRGPKPALPFQRAEGFGSLGRNHGEIGPSANGT
ncbi:hypothetical protein [Bradyrhizobium sp. DOA9]|uniref:hypothetical protein n=1 Tax=Bradyrhizobium sp. DOA9 TaxID=1126627 RepID=UPI00046990AD|nr:hypothetical protein [Bradyrhizobium sp. DOA9]